MPNQNEGRVTYTATGSRQVIQETFFVDTIRFHGARNDDPAAQTFSFAEDTLVTSVGLFFGTKDAVSITVQLRNVENGYPGPTALGSVVLQPSEVQVSSDGSVETKCTFDDPILCLRDTEYCWVAMTNGSQYRLHVAKMGEKDLITGAFVPAQPFIGGTFFTSNDNRAWTAHQEMDAKFKIYAAQFDNTDAILNFDKITGIEAVQLALMINQIVPSGTSVTWEASLDGTSNWIPLVINSGVTSFATKYTDCYIRARLSGNGQSPIINASAIVATGIKFAISGKYINRNIITLANFTKVNIWADIYNPSGSAVVVKFSKNDGVDWVNATQVGSDVVDTQFNQLHFMDTVTSSNQFRVDIEMTGTESVYAQIRRLMVTLE